MAPDLSHADDEVLTQLRAHIQVTVGRYVPGGSRVALLNYPNHSNVGDCAIWLGEVAYLDDVGCEIAYRCDIHSYNPSQLRSSLNPDGIVLLHGGGNFGDLWPRHQRFREQVLSDLPDYRVVVMPQTIHFQDRSSLDTARSAVGRHDRLTILTRDQTSCLFARSHFDCTVDLTPDMALWLSPSGRAQPPEEDILWLVRTDIEAPAWPERLELRGIRTIDWLEVRRSDVKLRSWFMLRALKRLTGLSLRTAGQYRPVSALQSLLFDPVASAHYERGRRLLSRGRVVIADRLHAHLLCLLMGIPHVLLDNNYGKLSGFWKTWTHRSNLTHWAPDHHVATELAYGLVDR